MNPTLLSHLNLIPIPITSIAAIREDRGIVHLSVRSDGKLYRYQIRGSEAILIGIGGTAKPRVDAVDAAKIDEVYRKYRDTVNMSATELEEWADTEASGRASVDRSPIRRNLELLRTPKDQWTEKHVTWANRTISFVSRMRGAEQGEDVSKDVPYSKRDISLKNWAFDPGKRGDAAEIRVGSTVRWNYGDGTGEGKVTRIYTEPTTLTIKGAEIKRNGTEENPAYEIEQEGGDRVLKLASEVQRVDAKLNVTDLVAIKEVLETLYTDGIDAIRSAVMEGENIVGKFRDGIKIYSYSINPDATDPAQQIEFQLDNPDEVRDDEAIFRMDAAKKCSKGTACGGTCIPKNRKCKNKEGISEETKSKAKAVKSKLKEGAAPSAEPAPEKPKRTRKAKPKPEESAQSEAQQPQANTPEPEAPKPRQQQPDTPEPEAPKQPEQPASAGDFPNRMKRQPPEGARPDFTEDDVINYVQDKGLVNRQDNPNSPHNLTLEQWQQRQRDEGLTDGKGQYIDELKQASEDGMVIPDAVLNQKLSGFSKADRTRIQNANADNQSAMDERRDRIKPIDDLLDKPIVDPADAENYKPSMTEAEAAEYTRNSFTGDWSFYHGGGEEAIDSITEEGVRVDLNDRGMFGAGFYMGSSRETAEAYGRAHVETKVNVRNPYIIKPGEPPASSTLRNFASSEEGEQLIEQAFGSKYGSPASTPQSLLYRIRGYDSIYVQDAGYMIAFDQRQVVSVGRGVSRSQDELNTAGVGATFGKPGGGFNLENTPAYNELRRLEN